MASRTLAVLLGMALVAAPALAAQNQPSQSQPPAQAQKPQPPTKTPPSTKPVEEETVKYEEQVVVTASKVEQQLINAPATVSVINQQTLASRSAADYATLFRTVPGVNVSQTSAREVNITSRGATGTLSTSQLALIDGRSMYLDFFGFIAWDFLPVNFNEVKQIEIIRGPASAVWGANAMSGVVNIITKSPRELNGTSVAMGYGVFDREVGGNGADAGGLWYINGYHAGVINDRWSYKLSGGFYSTDAFSRPLGLINNPARTVQTPYPQFENAGSEQPKVDGRLDYDFADGQSRITVAGGYAGTTGIVHTGIGPFRMEQGSDLKYGKADYSHGAFKAKFFTNILDGDAPALLAVGLDGKPIKFFFNTKTFDFDVSNISTIGTRHVLSYGANVRRNTFDLSIAPGGDTRNEQGIYLQDEIFLSEKFRWLVGARLDHFDVLKDPVISPRTTFMFKPAPDHTVRVSYNEAYRAPSLINNYLDVTVVNQLNLGALNPALSGRTFNYALAAQGYTDLTEQRLKAYEVGYSGVINNRVSVSLAVYYNDMRDDVYFTQVGSYSSSNVPQGWPLPPSILDALIAAGAGGSPGLGLPSNYSYRNLGWVKTKGVEAGVDGALSRNFNAYVNYSWQSDPSEHTNIAPSELNKPPTHRFNAGINFNSRHVLGSVDMNTQSKAYWQDVLDASYAGWTDSFTLLNASIGIKLPSSKAILQLKGNNLLNQEVMQHVFGDVIKRSVVAELRVTF
jgi:outer membrane receptor protein involved in Fe transport